MIETATRNVLRILLATLAALPLFSGGALAETRIGMFGTPGAFGVEVNPRTNKAYVGTGSGIAIVDSATNTMKNVAPNAPIFGVAVNPRTNRIYALRGGDASNPAAVNVIDGLGDDVIGTIALPANGAAIAVNTATDEIYVAMPSANQVAIIDGGTGSVTAVAAGSSPAWLAVNAVTNRVYVSTSGTLYVIDGATKVASVFAASVGAGMVAVNPVTNKVYAMTVAGAGILELDGVTGAAAPIPTGAGPTGIVVNPATNKIYVATTGATCCSFGGDVEVIDGATHATTTVGAGEVRRPVGLALNPVTNMIYVRSSAAGNEEVVVIDGATNATHKFTAPGFFPGTSSQTGLAVNPVTNMLYLTSALVGVTVFDASVDAVSTIPIAGPVPFSGRSLAASPTTGKIYIANPHGTVTVLDEATNNTTDVTVGAKPGSIAVNHATNRIYVGNQEGASVSVIDGATNAVTAVPVELTPIEVAVNTVTDKVYVIGSGSLKVIDGASNTVGTVPVAGAMSIAIDESTNRFYVGTQTGGVAVFDGASNTLLATLPFPGPIYDVDVNPATNKLYVGTSGNIPGTGRLHVVDATSYAMKLIHESPVYAAGRIVVNPLTNKVYTGWIYAGGAILVVDGATDTVVKTIGTIGGLSISIDSVANKVYVANFYELLVIDGATDAFYSIPMDHPYDAYFAVVNPVTQRVYLGLTDLDQIRVVRPSPQRLANHDTDVAMSAGVVTSDASPTLSLAVCCAYAPNDPPVDKVYFRVGHANGPFTAATGAGPFSATLSGVRAGLNFVTAFATDAMQGTSMVTGQGSLSMIGAPRVFAFTYAPPLFSPPGPAPQGTAGATYSYQLPLGGGIAPVTFTIVEGRLPNGLTLSAGGLISGTPTEDGFFAFTVSATDAAGTTVSQVFTLTVTSSNAPRLGNISTRALASSGQDVVIGGFVIGGSANKTVVVRARGPSLTAFGVSGALANPTLQLVRSSDQTTVAINDDWGSAANAAVVAASGFAPADALESAILVNLPPGAYTAIVSGAGGSTGVAIVEVFELDHPEIPLANISTRAQVQSGSNLLIGGFVVQGSGPQTVVVRARGPSLAAFGITGALSNPGLTLIRSADQVAIAANDNWMGAPNAADIQASGFAPASQLESAILVTLQPGAYTAVVNSVDGPPGVGIVEVFAIP